VGYRSFPCNLSHRLLGGSVVRKKRRAFEGVGKDKFRAFSLYTANLQTAILPA
jgi:hypothetical protein